MASTCNMIENIIKTSWSSSGNDEAIKLAASIIITNHGSITAAAASEDSSKEPKTSSPEFTFRAEDNEAAVGRLMSAIQNNWSRFSWKSVCFGVKMAAVFVSEDAHLRLIHMEAGAAFTQHSYDDAIEVLHVLYANSNAQIGPVEEWTSGLKTASFHSFMPTSPKTIRAGNGPLLALSGLLVGATDDITWPDEKCGLHYGSNLMSVQGTGINSVAEYYDNLAEDYDTAVRAWGYCLPECVTEALLKHTTLEPEAVILDLGCGNGLCGDALFKRGFGHVVGADISQKSLDVAKTRNCYKSLVRADLLQELPFEANSFDYLICVGVTSYLNPGVLGHWLDVVKPGGIISFNVKTSKWADWEAEQHRLEVEQHRWRLVWTSSPIAYLPSLRAAGDDGGSSTGTNFKEEAKIYIYRKNSLE